MGEIDIFGHVNQLPQDVAEIPADLPSQILSHQQAIVKGLQVWQHTGTCRR